MAGYYLMHRGWMNHPVFRAAPFTEREAWLWLIEEAAYADRRFRMGAQIINLRRGQLVTSYRFLAQAWGWGNAKKPLLFLKRLEMDTMIETQSDTRSTMITICNYDIYQTTAHEDETPDETQNETPMKHKRNADETPGATKQKKAKEGKKGKERKEDLSVSADDDVPDMPGFLVRNLEPDADTLFDEWWAEVPKKVAKDRALKAFNAALKKTDYPTLLAGIRRYSEQVRGKEGQYIAHPATWLNDGRWKDEEAPKGRGGQTLDDAFDRMDEMVMGG